MNFSYFCDSNIDELDAIADYIENNVAHWEEGALHTNK